MGFLRRVGALINQVHIKHKNLARFAQAERKEKLREPGLDGPLNDLNQ